MHPRLIIIGLFFLTNLASADVFDSSRKKCQKLSNDHSWIELTDQKDQSIAGFCEIDKVKDGPTLEPYPGTETVKKEGPMKKGQMHGEWRRYYANGKLKDEGNWFEGSPDGEWSFWNESGDLTERGKFFKGTKVCTWSKWDSVTGKTVEEFPGPSGGSCSRFVFEPLRFTAYGVFLYQSSSNYLISGGVGFEPKLSHTSFPLYLTLAISSFANRGVSGSMFPVVEVVPRLGAMLFQKWSLEIGAGMQFWMTASSSNGNTNPILQGKIGRQISFWKVSEVWLNYGALGANTMTHEMRAGITIKL